MTLTEAREAAQKGKKVICGGVRYARIEFVGYKYTEDGREIPSVRLLDKNKHSVTDATPRMCEVAPDEMQIEVEHELADLERAIETA